ncbi:MAG TPA: hypothetical protein VIV11_35385 [Kofleriaceae bacterium]
MHREWFALLAALYATACDGEPTRPDAAAVPVFRNPIALADSELALEALRLLGAQVPGANPSSCNSCHGLTHQRLRYWRALSDTALATCLTDLDVTSRDSALAMIDCMRAMPSVATSDFQTTKLGVFSTAARLPWFAYTFGLAFGDDAPVQLAAFEALAGMPRDRAETWTQDELDIVAEWFVRGLPELDRTLVVEPPPSQCQPGIASAVGAHVTVMATQGWRAINAQNQMAMLGCGAATDPRDCLQSYPLAVDTPFGSSWQVPGRGRIRVLRDAPDVTSFWTRSSADGRFVAHGVANESGSQVIDLQRNVAVPIDAEYDPAFFPDHSGFAFQGGPRNTCSIAVLTSNPTAVSMTEPGCRAIAELGLYQHLSRMLGGGDYFALASVFVSDDGGKLPTLRDPDAAFGADAHASFTPMLFDGTQYAPLAAVEVATPFEGDAVLSPSSKLTIARLAGPDDNQLGYVLREINATRNGSTYAIAATEIARYCVTGGKPAFSYDERWLAFHHYVQPADALELGFTGPGDPGFAPYLTQGAANLYLMELSTSVAVRVTNMRPGQYALYPHFRSDGWVYAQVRDATAGREYSIASDAALQ